MMERLSKFRVDDDWIDREIEYLKKRMNDDSNDALRTAISVQNLFALLEEIKERRESDTMERVSNEWLDEAIPKYGAIDSKSKGANVYLALCELRERRQNEISEKDGAGATQEKAVLPIPCTKGFEGGTVKDYFQKINEELDELKAEALNVFYSLELVPSDRTDLQNVGHGRMPKIADEAADTITAITSMLEAMGIDEWQRQAAQRRVNKRNAERKRL